MTQVDELRHAQMAVAVLDPNQLVSDGLMTVPEVAAFLRLSRSTVYALMEKGALPYVRIGAARRVPRRAVIDLAAANLRGEFHDRTANY